jgi:hypothetical protein
MVLLTAWFRILSISTEILLISFLQNSVQGIKKYRLIPLEHDLSIEFYNHFP